MSVPFVPKNTIECNEWAYNNFQVWLENRNRSYPEDQCPKNLLHRLPWDPAAMSHWLARFACETRTVAGEKYPATTVFSLLSGLLHRTRAIDPDCPNFMDMKDARFREVDSIIDSYFRELHESGVGAEVKRTCVITKEEENALWEKGVWGVDMPETLLRIVFYYNGKNLCLWGGKEHRAMKISQIVRHHDMLTTSTQRMARKIEAAVIIQRRYNTLALLHNHHVTNISFRA